MPNAMTSIFLPLLLVVGVVWSRSLDAEGDGNTFQPFMTTSDKRRVCVELCLTGLGGSPCGSDCIDIMPHNLPIQLDDNMTNSNSDKRHVMRNSSCPVLCKNNLGNPLCSCDNLNVGLEKDQNNVNFVEICSDFCIRYSYRLAGCQKCSIYQTLFSSETDNFGQTNFMTSSYNGIDWYAWCQNQCGKGDGGAACNCDRLPIY
ncbi:uncharacterized protein LOC130451207 [Diorhabda sublineata]|uniref:uncharacterized protein LOC130451207 n=1 Tax=Diorhabda sublineata TaxID=1163346 RepID=UPI0024E17434|nr:uncharacterized protein LOC130451207 [Diorhabda sublineata]